MRCVLLQPNLKEDGGLLRLVGLGQVLEEVPGRLKVLSYVYWVGRIQ